MRQSKKVTEIIKTYRRVFESPDGKIVLADMMKSHNFLSTSFKKDALELAYAEGERNVVLRILHFLELDLDKILERVKEYEETMGE